MSTPPRPAQLQADTQHYNALLDELLELGMALARTLPARTASAQDPILDIATAFERLARGVRRTIVLARHLHDPAPAARDFEAAQNRAAARRRVIREVEDAIHRHDPADRKNLRAELHERLETPELDDELARRPLPEIIANIIRDFGIAAGLPGPKPWKRRTPEDIAALCALAARLTPAPSSAGASDPAPAEEPQRLFRLVPSDSQAEPTRRASLLDSAAFFPLPKKTE